MRFNSPEFGPDSTLFPDPPDYEELKKIRIWRILVLLVFVAILSMLILGAYEFRTSAIQAAEAERLAARLTYELQPGKSTQTQYPEQGPFDRRLGYSRLPEFLARLQPEWSTSRQVSMSDALIEYINLGFYPPYKEKDQVGLTVLDCRGEAFYQFNYPGEHYADFAQVPPLVWKALLFIEDRNLFSNEYPTENPAINWLRLSKAAFYRVVSLLGISVPSMGGSTLATQIEKYRHSSDGLTSSVTEKLQQLVSATVRIYQQGGDTSEERRRLVLSYLNTVPLAAAPRHGEVHGVLDGLRVWFAADPGQVNRILRSHPSSPAQLAEQGLALKQVLALMIAHRRPSWYLLNGRDELDDLVASYVRLMFKAGEVSRELKDAALQQKIQFRDFNRTPIQVTADISKAQTLIRNKVASALDVSLYDLDRLDLSVASALHAGLQYQVTDYLKGLNQKENAQEAGLFGHRLLKPGQAQDLQYSFTLFERTAAGNRVRVQTDNTDQPFDINEGSKLELGSTAKLRVLATYLEIVAELHTRITEQDKPLILNQDSDPLTRWAVEYLAQAEHRDLENMLSAAMTRSYSANPRQHFFTGGGEHIFSNFLARDNSRSPTVIESLRESINLPFVRMLQDIIKYIINENLDKNAQLLGDDKDPRRLEYLERFADREGSVFLRRFWHKYNRGQKQPEQMETLLSSFRQTENTLAAVHRTVLPDARLDVFAEFMHEQLGHRRLSNRKLAELYLNYAPGAYSLQDLGYITSVHPLELWLVRYLFQHPESDYQAAKLASHQQRLDVYEWLYRSRAKNARDSRIRIILEIEAFSDLHERWKRLGYPFNHLVPSLGTALGSSGDRPAALAELMGIIINNGKRMPTLRVGDLQFAPQTPYEVRLTRHLSAGEQVMRPEVASALRHALSEVVADGTARRIHGAISGDQDDRIVIGGKTGTGDNRLVTTNRFGERIKSKALNRTATFVFYIGENYFGTLTAYVIGGDSGQFKFTSSLPVQVLKSMAPLLEPTIQGREAGETNSTECH